MAILTTKPSRSYAEVDHDPHGLSAVGNAPYVRKDGFKTYRPSLVETHLKRPAMYDPNPSSAFSPLPPAFNLSRQARRDQAMAGQRAEIDHILQPAYMDDTNSIAGPSRSATARTAGGLAADRKRGKGLGLGLRHSQSVNNVRQPNSAPSGQVGGIYVDANGKVHDTEFDPFGGIAEMTRRKSRRRSAFGSDRRKGSGSSSSSSSGSDVDQARKSMDHGVDEEEVRRRRESERRRIDEASGLAAARRRSMMSEKHSGRATPSIRSSDEGGGSAASTQFDRMPSRSKSQQGYYVPSPLSPTFGQPTNGHTYSSRNLGSGMALGSAIEESPPQKSTERTNVTPKLKERTPTSISITDKKITITGFDAPHSARPLTPAPETPNGLTAQFENLRVPDTVRLSSSSRRSSELSRVKPVEPPREDLYPETPAQAKKREERERRAGLALASAPRMKSRQGSLRADTTLSQSGRGRVLPEIEIVEDDDPRIVFPEGGRSTRVQTKHDHVIRGPFSMALNAQGSGSAGGSFDGMGRRASADLSFKSIGGGSKPPSTILEEGQGGYLPSRWASGDHNLRVTEDEREKYRPREWGGKTGELGGRHEEWKPTTKDQIKRNLKDISTSARFGMFRAKKKLLRKTEM